MWDVDFIYFSRFFRHIVRGANIACQKRILAKVDVKQFLQHLISMNISIGKCKIQGLNLQKVWAI